MAKYELVTDEQLVNLVESGVANSVGDWLNSSDLARERLKSTYEYAGVADNHLKPQGVSSIVDTSTTESVEAYTAILCDLFLNNGKIAKFSPYAETPGAHKVAHDASLVTNYCIFKQNNGWEELQTWIKSALLWKNGIIRWDYCEDFAVTFEEYERISQTKLDELLSDEKVEIVGDLEYENEMSMDGSAELVYVDVRIKRTIDKSRVKIENVPPENFRISRDATTIENASFVGVQTSMTRSEIRRWWPEVAETIDEDKWDELSTEGQWGGNTRYSEDVAARKQVTGQEYWQGSTQQDMYPLEANREVTITECWLRVDRDGDGIAELKHFIMAGTHILLEEDCDLIPIASLSPIDIPYEFYGLSIADFTRSSTLASTAILRGFVENTYLTNYSPKLADPNVVDFSALQNMKPKQIIPTNGSPLGAVAPLAPETISTGTVPLLQHLQTIKEQATGMSKAAQGLNDTLYVSGNSEQKLAAVQSASQKRIQHIARRFAETGFKRLIEGVYHTIRKNMDGMKVCMGGVITEVDCANLPYQLDCEVHIDIGENSNANMIGKLQQIGQQVLPALNQAGAGMIVKPEAPAVLATKLIEALGLDSDNFLEDYTTDEFKQKAAQALQAQTEAAQMKRELENRKIQADVSLSEANVNYTNTQSANAMQDNTKQLAVAIDKHFQEWADLTIKAQKEGTQLPPHPGYDEIIALSAQLIKQEEVVMAEYSVESQVPPMSIKAMKALGVEQPRLLLTQEELNSPVVTGGDHLKDKNRMFYGDKAVAEVERRLGEELPEHYKRIVREEGFFSGRYLDDAEVPVVTAGVGQTGPYINAPLSNVFESKAKQVRSAIPHYDKLPDDVKGAVLSAQYRGDLLPEHNWVKQFNKGNYGVAADSFLNHKEYKSRKAKDPNDGVVKRMDDIAHILRSYE